MKKMIRYLVLITLFMMPHLICSEDEEEEQYEEQIEEQHEEQYEDQEEEVIESSDIEGPLYTIKTNQKEAAETYDKSWLGKIRLKTKDITMYLGGGLRDEYFFYNHVNTLRNDFNDKNDFIRHKLNVDWSMFQGVKRYGKPATEAFVRLSNYIYWQNNSAYTPIVIDDIRSIDMNLSLAQNVPARTLMPLIFTEQAWLKINLDAFSTTFKKYPTFIQVGLFQYAVGRGITLGYHDDLSVEALGWPGEGNYTRFPYMPPGILWRTQVMKNLTLDFYFSKWREVSATLEDTTQPTRQSRLFGQRPERGKDKDRDVFVLKADYTHESDEKGKWLAEPYWVYFKAPELQVEFQADASAHLHTLGMMVDVHYKNFNVNIEVAGQMGHQKVHAIDRNIIKQDSQGQPVLSHVFFQGSDPFKSTSRVQVPVRGIQSPSFNPQNQMQSNLYPENHIDFIVNQPVNRSLCRQGEPILDPNSNVELAIVPNTGQNGGIGEKPIFNSNAFGNKRFRNPFKLDYRGFMALADISYEFDDVPLKLAAAGGYIGGDEYPYNKECSRTFSGFTPLRSWYKGLAVENILIFDRLVIPRPMNISYRTLYAFNNTKNLSDLQFIGLGITAYPLKDRRKLSFTTDAMFLWKVAEINAWDKCGKHPDPSIEAQIAIDRKLLGFTGWESTEKARRLIGVEWDIKALYQMLDSCLILAKVALFFPGGLYRDLDGQPNIVTRRIDEFGNSQYKSLGSQTAFAFVCGFDYRF